MAPQTSMLHVRIDDQIKNKAATNLKTVGLSISDAVRILLTRVVEEGGLPAGLTCDTETYDAWFRRKVQEALDDPTEETFSHKEVMASAEKIIKKHEKKAHDKSCS